MPSFFSSIRCLNPPITKHTVATKIAAYLHHEITLAQLVDWSESALIDDEFDEADAAVISRVIARLGVADVRAFGLTWENCEELLNILPLEKRDEVADHGWPMRNDFLRSLAAHGLGGSESAAP